MLTNDAKIFGWDVPTGEITIHSQKSDSFYIQYNNEKEIIKIFQEQAKGLPKQENYKNYSGYNSYYPIVIGNEDSSYTLQFLDGSEIKKEILNNEKKFEKIKNEYRDIKLIDVEKQIKQAEKINEQILEIKKVLSEEGTNLLLKMEEATPKEASLEENEKYIAPIGAIKKIIGRMQNEEFSIPELREIDKYFLEIAEKNESKNSEIFKSCTKETIEAVSNFEMIDEQNKQLKGLQNNLIPIVKGSEEMLYAIKTVTLSTEEIEQVESLNKIALIELKKWGEILKIFEPIDSIISRLEKIVGDAIGGREKSMSFEFNSLKNVRKVDFATSGPSWRYVIPGLNMYGTCNTSVCKAYNDAIWIQKGMGTFNIAKEVKTSKCSLCNKKAKNVTNLGFYGCKYTIEGEKEGGEEVKKEEIAERERFTTFVNGDNIKWEYLEVTTKPNTN
jgi:hypothetical protein